MANADFMQLAKEDYEKNHPGKKWEDLAYSTRKKYYYQAQRDFEKRTGKPAYSQAPGNIKFSDNFQQMTEEQKRHWLGKGRYEIWKRGNLDIENFIPPFPDQTFTVAQLKEVDKKSFKAKPKKTKDELHRELLKHRKEQEKKAYENRLNRWKQEIVKNGGSDKIADVLADEYTLEVARIHKPPPVKFVRREKQTFCAGDGGYIQLHKDPSNWYGYPDAARHEFLHWKHYWSMKKGIITPEELIEAAEKDYKSFLDNCRKSGISLDVFKRSHAYDAARKYYPDFKDDANQVQRSN